MRDIFRYTNQWTGFMRKKRENINIVKYVHRVHRIFLVWFGLAGKTHAHEICTLFIDMQACDGKW